MTARDAWAGTAGPRPDQHPDAQPAGIGNRVARLRTAHGESLREAALRTGVSHTTITRIEKGEVTGSFHSTLEKIASGYGVSVEYLLTGRDPHQEFTNLIRSMPEERRYQFYFLSPRHRTLLVLDFLRNEYPAEFGTDKVARQAGLSVQDLENALAGWEQDDSGEEVYLQVATVLSRLTGISRHWFYWGGMDEETGEIQAEQLAAYVELIKKAARCRISPQVLEAAINLLMMQSEGPERRSGARDLSGGPGRRP